MERLTLRAERALLRGVRLPDGFGCLRPGDFMLEQHRRVYTAITTAGQTWNSLSPERREAAELAASFRTSPRYLGELQVACPDPFHAPAYAALVLEACLCRAVSAYAGPFSLEASLLRGQVGCLARASGGSKGSVRTSRCGVSGGAAIRHATRSAARCVGQDAPSGGSGSSASSASIHAEPVIRSWSAMP